MVLIKDLKSNPVNTLLGSVLFTLLQVLLWQTKEDQGSRSAQCEPSQQQISARAFAQVCKRNAGNILLLIVIVLYMCLCVIFLSVKASFTSFQGIQNGYLQLLPGVELKDMIETNEWPTNLHL